MKIAILGAGYSGLATAWHLLNLAPALKITVFDPCGIGGEASKISAGLLHKYVSLHAKLNPDGIEAEAKTFELIQVAEETLKHSPILSKGILRLALTEELQTYYAKSASTYADVEWLSPEQCSQLIKGIPKVPGIFIHSGVALDTSLYLQGLFDACRLKGAELKIEKIHSLDALNEYEIVVCATGAFIPFPELANLKVYPVKGQLLKLSWPSHTPPLPFSLSSQIYLTMDVNPNYCIVGATYEHDFKDAFPDSDKAMKELYPKALALYPALQGAEIVEVRSAIRASTPTHLPFVGAINPKLWVITGMGSRGLLYHSFYAEKLAKKILSSI